MIGMRTVVAGAKDGRKILAAARARLVEQAFLAEAEPARLANIDVLAVAQFDAHHIQCVALAVFGQRPGAGDAAAGIARSLVDRLDAREISPARRRRQRVSGPAGK